MVGRRCGPAHRVPSEPPPRSRLLPACLPHTVYRNLIDATEREVELVLVGGDSFAGDTELMSALKPRDVEVVPSAAGGFHKAVDVTTTAPVPDGDETLAQLTSELQAGLAALGGDNPPPGGGPGPPANT